LSRVTDFDDTYAESRDRLLLQLYAYCGDADAADDALNEAFITASRHWQRLKAPETLHPWLRERAVRRLAGPLRTQPHAGARQPSRQNARLLATLGKLDPTSRHLLIVRRLDDVDLASAAREVGLTTGAAEQSLARASSALHGNGVDTTPAALRAGLTRLGDDLEGLDASTPKSLRRAGSRRRYAATTLLGLALIAVAAGAGTLAASRPLASVPGTIPSPTTPVTPTTPTVPPPQLGDGYLLTGDQVSRADVNARWRTLPAGSPPTTGSVYGDCVQAAVNPPPDTAWIRDFATGAGRTRSRLRQVLQLAPSDAEAKRAFRQILAGFSICEGHQLVDYSRVRVLGERTYFIRLLAPGSGGSMVENVVISESGPAVTVLSTTSPSERASALSPSQIVRLAGTAVDRVCSETAGGCALPPYTITGQSPPSDGTASGFLAVVDLPLVPGVSQPWVGTNPKRVTGNPSATACDQADFAGHGATGLMSRSYVIPQATGLPTLFGLSETLGTFPTSEAARAFLGDVTRDVASCHKRQVTLTVLKSTSFSLHRTSGRVWQLRQKVSKKKVVTFRVALVRFGHTVAEVTFTPVGTYDVSQVEFVALARRAAVRLNE